MIRFKAHPAVNGIRAPCLRRAKGLRPGTFAATLISTPVCSFFELCPQVNTVGPFEPRSTAVSTGRVDHPLGLFARKFATPARHLRASKLRELKCLPSIQSEKMLSRIVYYSRNLLRSRRAGREGSLTDILRVSRSHNAALGVTGALLFNHQYFAQVLEGERSSISHLFCKICRDSRHEAVTIVEAKIIAARKFQNWSMALVRLDDGSAEAFAPTELDGDSLTEEIARLLSVQDDAISIAVPVPKVGV